MKQPESLPCDLSGFRLQHNPSSIMPQTQDFSRDQKSHLNKYHVIIPVYVRRTNSESAPLYRRVVDTGMIARLPKMGYIQVGKKWFLLKIDK